MPSRARLIAGSRRTSQGRPAEIFVRLVHAGNSARHTDSEQAVVVGVVHYLTVQSKIHAVGCRQRRLLAKIKGGRLPIGTMVNHESTTTDIARGRISDCQGKSGGNSRINRIPHPA